MPTTITGVLVEPGTNLVTSGTYVRFQLKGTGLIQPVITGVGALTQGQGSGREWFVDFLPNTSGVISGSVYSTRDATGLLAGEITVNGNGTACWWEVSIYRNGKKYSSVHTHAKTGATLDIGALPPLTSNPLPTSLTNDAIYARLDGTNAPFTGQVVGKNGTVGSPSFAFASSTGTGFWRQAADVIGVSIAGVLKWLVNSAGQLFGSGQAIAWSSNADPSLAAGDSFFTRIGAAIWGLGSTNGGTNGELRLAKVNKVTVTQPANGSTLTIADGVTITIPVTGTAVTGTGTTNRVPKYTTGANAVIGDSSITDNGTAVSSSLPFTLTPTFQSFTTAGTATFTIPAGITATEVILIAGGGAGGGATAGNGGAGGGAGGIAIKFLSGLTSGNTIAVTVGAGGTGVSGAAGNAGAASTIASGTQTITTVTANPGAGGASGTVPQSGGNGGAVSTNGDINGFGAAGSPYIVSPAGAMGGATMLGGNGNIAGGSSPGNAASANTGGGGGGAGAGASNAGGAGGSGIVIFKWVK